MDSYIIRIYRRDKKDPRKAAGVVEVIGEEGKKGFLDSTALWAILTTPWGEPAAMTLAEILKRTAKGKK